MAILLTAAIGLSAQALATVGQPTRAVVWGSLGFAAYAASLLCLVGGGQEKFLGLGRWWFGSWTLLWYCTAFGLATLSWVQPQTGTSAEISLSSVLRALWLVAVGMTLWVLGYLVGPGPAARRFGNKVMAALSLRFAPEVRSPLAPWIPLRGRRRGEDCLCGHDWPLWLCRKCPVGRHHRVRQSAATE